MPRLVVTPARACCHDLPLGSATVGRRPSYVLGYEPSLVALLQSLA